MKRVPNADFSDAIVCTLCGAVAQNTSEAGRLNWDWFTGYLKKRFVACATCRLTKASTIDAERETSKVKR